MAKVARILIVDDSAASSELTKEQISETMTTAVMVMARDGQEGLRMLKKSPIDLVVTDEVMPNKSGSDLVVSARASGLTVPFIILTGLSASDVNIKARFMPHVYVLEKPADPEALRTLIGTILKD